MLSACKRVVPGDTLPLPGLQPDSTASLQTARAICNVRGALLLDLDIHIRLVVRYEAALDCDDLQTAVHLVSARHSQPTASPLFTNTVQSVAERDIAAVQMPGCRGRKGTDLGVAEHRGGRPCCDLHRKLVLLLDDPRPPGLRLLRLLCIQACASQYITTHQPADGLSRRAF